MHGCFPLTAALPIKEVFPFLHLLKPARAVPLAAAAFRSSGGQAIPAEFAKGLDDLMDRRGFVNLQLLLIKDSLPGG